MYRPRFGLIWLDWLTSAMSATGAAIILLVMVVILTDAFGRGFFAMPLVGTPEIVAMSIASIVFLQYPSTVRADRTIRSTLVTDLIETRTGRSPQLLVGVHHLLGCIIFAVILYYLVPTVLKAYATGSYYGVPGRFTFPKWYLFLLLAFSCGITALQYLVVAAIAFVGVVRREPLVDSSHSRVEDL